MRSCEVHQIGARIIQRRVAGAVHHEASHERRWRFRCRSKLVNEGELLQQAVAVTGCGTAAAIITPVVPQAGGVAIVRVSGDDAVDVVRRIFRPGRMTARRRAEWAVESHKAVYGYVCDVDDSVVDEVLVLPMLKPRSYTAEDVVEVHCHGGSVCVQRVLQLCLRSGARLAEPGEFTLRAFLNGRLDLLQAEAVNAIIQARTVEAADSALAVLRGGLSPTVDVAQHACVSLIAELEARIDFDDELPPLDLKDLAQRVGKLRDDVSAVLQAARRGLLMTSGVQVAIVGRPNVGKSSLLNAWSRSERAIVTAVPGTTRDIVEAAVSVHGVPVTLLDTAGIRSAPSDEVESIGIERSKAAAAGADVVLMVISAQDGWATDDDDILHAIVHGDRLRPALLVVNKVDQAPAAVDALPTEVTARFHGVIGTSALRGLGIPALEDALSALLGLGAASVEGSAWVANQRQADALEQAVAALGRMQEAVAAELPIDCWVVELREAALGLGMVTGSNISDDVLASIFSRFCIGK